MIDWDDAFQTPTPTNEAEFAAMRILGRTTVGRTFPMAFGHSTDIGQPARTVWQIISDEFELVVCLQNK